MMATRDCLACNTTKAPGVYGTTECCNAAHPKAGAIGSRFCLHGTINVYNLGAKFDLPPFTLEVRGLQRRRHSCARALISTFTASRRGPTGYGSGSRAL